MLPLALALDGISKRYGALHALRDVSLHVEAGTVHALLGENGAGKTTLMHVAFGMVKPDAGSVHVNGRREELHSPADAIGCGLGMVHQHFSLVPAMTVAENLALGGHGRLHARTMTDTVRRIADQTGFALEPGAMVEDLPIGAQQRVEIAKALARCARILILDEPTAVLAPAEADDLLRWIRTFANAGNAVVLITHKLNEALAVADSVTVLRRGRVVLDAAAARTSALDLTSAMLGMEAPIPSTTPAASESRGEEIFIARNVSVRDERGVLQLRDASLSVREGEILGVAGVEGSGQRELLRALAGRVEVDAGTLKRPERLGFVPEDRHHDAVLLDRSLTENVALREAGWRRGRMPWPALRARTQRLMQQFDVRAPSDDASMRSLSGGNQQKLVLGREIGLERMTTPIASRLPVGLVVENPTRGLDVLATVEVHARLRAARDAGAAIVLYSSDLDEVLALSTRMVVAHTGTVREVPMDREAVGRAMLGA
jgi:ABC-type uncharacterized transport system ATPase subunit